MPGAVAVEMSADAARSRGLGFPTLDAIQTASDEISNFLADRKREAVKMAFLFLRLMRMGSAPKWRPKIASRDSSGRSRR